ncbi:hypothetical protein [Pseudoalteromonas ostreae]|uniref:hypothetical protein n=1 Tax=Pseudoalteromonas ostreae TaxID=2774154 RepID=UPI001B367CDB|nr:hypothetical protein [Pseudoalteromonas ostreae]
MDNQALQIANVAPSNTGQNLEKLRQQGMARMQQFAPKTWTDHNRFDPGVTVLEVLVYVLSDLSYKLDYSVPELLAQPHSGGSVKFYEPDQVLFSHCVTEDDYRRLILDLLDVKNVHVTLRKVEDSNVTILDFNVLLYASDDDKKNNVTQLLSHAFSQARCVNHRLGNIAFYDISKVTVGMTLSLQHVDNLVALLIELYTLIGREISPDIPKYSAQQLLQRGMHVGQIYQGPKLQHGFVLDKDLHKSAYSVRLFSSNILSVLHGHENIDRVNAFRFLTEQSGNAESYNAQDGYEFWQIQFGSDDNAQIVNIAQLGFDEDNFFSDLKLLIDGQPYQLTEQEQVTIRQGLQVLNHPPEVASSVMLPKYGQAQHLALSDYRSLQHELPQVYAVTEQTLDADIDSAQKAQLLQFKGYLQLFDQILADQHKQLDALPDILSLPKPQLYACLGKLLDCMLASESLNAQQVNEFWQHACALPHSQLSQALEGVSGIEHLLDTQTLDYWQRGMQSSLESGFSIAQLTRLNQSADHLLARFAERPVDSNLLKYQAVFAFYASSLTDERDPNPDESLLDRLVLLRQYIDKCRLLCEIGELGQNRCRGFDYLSKTLQHQHCSSMAKGIMRRLGMSHPGHMPLATHNRESFYLVEGSLLESEHFSVLERELLSNSLYFVLPDWTTRFASIEFRQFAERKIREYTPLHMPVYCLWLDRESMSLFERLYYGWLNYFSQTQHTRFSEQSGTLLNIIEQLSLLLGRFLVVPKSIDDTGHIHWQLASLILTHQAQQDGNWSAVKAIIVALLNTYDSGHPHNDFIITGQNVVEIHDSVNENIISHAAHFPEGVDVDTIFYLTAQHYIDEICRPSLQEYATRDQRLTVGYTPLAYLKPLFPVSISAINPLSPEKYQFIVANSTPNRI